MHKICLALLMTGLSAGAFAFDLGSITNVVKAGAKVVQSQQDIDEPHEILIGADMTSKVLGVAPLVEDQELQRYVNHVGMWLASQSERPDLKWHFCVINSPSINAMSMPGGYVVITRGLFDRLRSESELAGVLGHEISHVVKKHQLKAIQSGMLKSGLAEGIQTAADSNGGGNAQFKAMAGKFALNIYTSGLDKSDEFEADRLGVVIAARGGYSPYGLVGVLQTLSLSSQDNAMKLLLATHPSPNDRLDQLSAAMGDKMDDLPNKLDDVPRFNKFKH